MSLTVAPARTCPRVKVSRRNEERSFLRGNRRDNARSSPEGKAQNSLCRRGYAVPRALGNLLSTFPPPKAGFLITALQGGKGTRRDVSVGTWRAVPRSRTSGSLIPREPGPVSLMERPADIGWGQAVGGHTSRAAVDEVFARLEKKSRANNGLAVSINSLRMSIRAATVPA